MKHTTAAHDTFVIERSYSAAPERVFAFFSDPAKKRRWLGGDEEGFEVEQFEANFKVDHYERWKFRFKGGVLIKNDVCYQDIVPNRRIVFVYTMTFGEKRVSSSQTTVEFVPTQNGTLLIHTEQGVFFDGADQAAGRREGAGGLL
jgi:uncharacterized protein YndB with AHSA1/START domain